MRFEQIFREIMQELDPMPESKLDARIAKMKLVHPGATDWFSREIPADQVQRVKADEPALALTSMVQWEIAPNTMEANLKKHISGLQNKN